MATKTEPLLAVGTFGVHIIYSSADHYHFVGTVPCELDGFRGTEQDCKNMFFKWLDKQPICDRREYVGKLRNDIFVEYLESQHQA